MSRIFVAMMILCVAIAHADNRVLRIGDSKGLQEALLTAAGELDALPYEIQWAEFPATAPALEALAAGAIDAWSTWDPYVSIAEVQDHFCPIVDGTGLSITDGVFVTSVGSIGAKRPLLEDVLRRQARAQAWAHQHLEDYAELYSTKTGLPIDAPSAFDRTLVPNAAAKR